MDDRSGVQTKYEKKPRVRNRIEELRKGDLTLEYREAKRRHLEARLELVAFGSIAEFMTCDENVEPHVDYRALLESDIAQTVHELRMDSKGKVTQISRDAPLNAIAQLREMRGFKAAEQRNVSLELAQQLTDEELTRIAAMEAATEVLTTPALPAPATEEESVVVVAAPAAAAAIRATPERAFR